MRIFRKLKGAAVPKSLVLCLGNFDGVHRGHLRVFQGVVREANRRGAAAGVLTFEPHPARVLRPDRAPLLLTTEEQKLARFESAGLTHAFVLRFNKALARMTPRQFVERILVGKLDADALFVGSSFRFGRGQAGLPDSLAEFAPRYGFSVKIVAPVVSGGAPVSSTRIRGLLMAGDVAGAARLLGRPYALTGTRVAGAGRGVKLGFPTLNLFPEQECLPDRGVYITRTASGKRSYPSVTNIGVRPTFGGSRLVVESHVLSRGFTGRPNRIEIQLLKRLRGEMKFEGPDALREQISRDIVKARRFHARMGS